MSDHGERLAIKYPLTEMDAEVLVTLIGYDEAKWIGKLATYGFEFPSLRRLAVEYKKREAIGLKVHQSSYAK